MTQETADTPAVQQPTDEKLPSELRSAIDNCLSENYKPGEPPPVPNHFKINSPRDAVKDAFQVVGGLPRLAHWADKNYDRFINGPFAKIITAQQAGTEDEPIHVKLSFDLGNRFGRTMEGVAVAEVIDEKKKDALPAANG